LIAVPRSPIVAPADLTRFLLAFGSVPLLLVSVSPPWSFALTPSWSLQQLGLIALAGVGMGVTSGRPAQGLAGVTLGCLLGLTVDLWWLSGWVGPYDQGFVTLMPKTEWRSSLLSATLSLLGAAAAGFLAGALVLRPVRGRSMRSTPRPTRTEAAAYGVAVIGAPLLALGIALAAASWALVVPDGAQIQSVWISHGRITLDPISLRPGLTRFRCHVAPDATPEWVRLIARPDGAPGEALPPLPEDFSSCSAYEPGTVTWGTIADLHQGPYVWAQYVYTEIPVRPITTSPVFLVAP
jgi:hypothetical protein